jgi:pyruvate dehydrogenase kinase 2/3/4
MRGDTSRNITASIPGEPRGLTRSVAGSGYGSSDNIAAKSMNLSMRAKRLKLSGMISQSDVSTRKQVGDAEAMLEKRAGEKPWWKNVGMEEGV